MAKVTKPFELKFPVTRKVVQDLSLTTEKVGELHIEGIAFLDPTASMLDIFERYSVDITSITWHGVEVSDLLRVTSDLFFASLEEAAIRHAAAKIFNLKSEEAA